MTTTSSRNKKKRSSSRSRSRARRRRVSGGTLFVGIFLGVLVILFGVIAFISRSDIGTGVSITPAEVTGDALAPLEPNAPDGAVGAQAPAITGTSIDGEPISVEPGDGTPKAIAFLAHWCPHCQREVPVVVDWLEDGGLPDGVELYGVATGIERNRPNFPPHDWFEREEWDVPTVVDGEQTANRAYGLVSYPFWVLVDGEGNVVQRWAGETTPEQLTERIGQLAESGG